MSNKMLDNYLNEIQQTNEAVLGITAFGLMSAVGLVNLGLALYKQFISKNKNRCEQMRAQDKQICYAQLQIDATQKFIGQIRSNLSDCKDTKNPAECTKKLNEKGRKLNLELSKHREKLYNLQNQQSGVRT